MFEEYKLVHNYFLGSVNEYGFHTALHVDNVEYSYSELKSYSIRLANFILAKTRSVSKVGIYTSRSLEAYAGSLASLIAGAAFVPLGKQLPLERTLSMILQTDLDVLLVDKTSIRLLSSFPENILKGLIIIAPEVSKLDLPIDCKAIYLKKDFCKFYSNTLPNIKTELKDIAYILFTSGSTGLPKGVPITHLNLSSFIEYNKKEFDFNDHDRFSQTFELTFDLSLFSLFIPWSCGASVHVLNAIELLAPYKYVQRHQITVWFSVPSVISILSKKNSLNIHSLNNLRYSFFCGEVLTITDAVAWLNAASNSLLFNLYGPTELTLACSYYQWRGDEMQNKALSNIVPIGNIYKHLEWVILDENNHKSDEGMLCVSGDQLFPGYLNNPSQTKRVTITRQTDINEMSYYITGDRVHLSNDGCLLYIGRMDQQIKIQGYRIELAEIEARIKELPNVLEAAAIGQSKEPGAFHSIIAYVAGNNLEPDLIKKDLCKYLPNYMVPETIVISEEIPLNGNGKIDRLSLASNS